MSSHMRRRQCFASGEHPSTLESNFQSAWAADVAKDLVAHADTDGAEAMPHSPTLSHASGQDHCTEVKSSERKLRSLASGGSDPKKPKLKQMQSGHLESASDVQGNRAFARLQRFVRGATFESAFALLIVLNCLVMALESQYEGIDNGWKVGYPNSSSRASDAWPGAKLFFKVAEWIFGILFTIELFLKLICLQKDFIRDAWNLIDTIIVLGWFITVLARFPMPIDPMLLRLARLARLLRLLRLIRKVRLFDSLYLMTTAMRGSFSVLLWSVVLLSLVQMLLALFLQSLLEVYILDEQKPEAARFQVFKFYGTFSRTMLTMFEMTLGNWMPPCRALVENVNEWWMLFSLFHKMVIGFSVVSVITSVFIQETFKVATIDDKIMVMSKERARKTHLRKMRSLFEHMDQDGSGTIDANEFQTVLADSELRTWLSAMELDVRDDGQLFELLDVDGDGELSLGEIVDGVSRLKGAARNYDVVHLHKENMEVLKYLSHLDKHLQEIGKKIKM
jgi:Ca2+-binding EF-hand superfamily protein